MENVVVTEENQFIDQLQDGDILLFDKLGSVHRLVQWADNRPVGHCGLWCDGSLFEATMKVIDNVKTSGVFRTSLPELLNHRVQDRRGGQVALVRTVTAMRHKNMTEDAQQRIRDFVTKCTESGAFAEREMVLLAPYALRRSYGQQAETADDMLDGVIRLCKLMAPKTRAKPDAPNRMFCSEFVYRSYETAGLPIKIEDPLYDSYTASRAENQPQGTDDILAPVYRDTGKAASTNLAQTGRSELDQRLADYDTLFETQVLDPPVAIGTTVEAPDDVDLIPGLDMPNEKNIVDWVFRRRPPEFHEMVTPGDYWTSQSLTPVVALHRPPGS